MYLDYRYKYVIWLLLGLSILNFSLDLINRI